MHSFSMLRGCKGWCPLSWSRDRALLGDLKVLAGEGADNLLLYLFLCGSGSACYCGRYYCAGSTGSCESAYGELQINALALVDMNLKYAAVNCAGAAATGAAATGAASSAAGASSSTSFIPSRRSGVRGVSESAVLVRVAPMA